VTRWHRRIGLGAATVIGAAVAALGVLVFADDDGDHSAVAPEGSTTESSTGGPATAATSQATTTSTAPPTVPATRIAALWPFSAESPWNTPLGRDAAFAAEDDPRTLAVRDGGASVNAGQFSHPVYRATEDAPEQDVHTQDGVVRYRIPEDAQPALPPWGGDQYTDAHLHVVDPSGRYLDECFHMRRRGDGAWQCGFHQRIDLFGDGVSDGGTRAYGGSAIGGLIRVEELEAGLIPHVLAFAMPNERMLQGPVWPATRQDNDDDDYTGPVPMGSLVAIPPDVDLAALDLTPGGMVLARALQDYGAYLVDGSRQFVFYAEPVLEDHPAVHEMRADADLIQSLLLPVLDNSPTSVGGAGARRAVPAPPLVG
jgi:hypothetical protein